MKKATGSFYHTNTVTDFDPPPRTAIEESLEATEQAQSESSYPNLDEALDTTEVREANAPFVAIIEDMNLENPVPEKCKICDKFVLCVLNAIGPNI